MELAVYLFAAFLVGWACGYTAGHNRHVEEVRQAEIQRANEKAERDRW